jgi:uncharacterized membrane protein
MGTKKWINRGFLYGPIIPIYGFGALLVSLLLTGYYNDPIVIIVMSMIICSSLEYFISFLMEQIFHNRWWDYSTQKYNINGRVCLKNTILFGIGSLGIIYLINPVFDNLIKLIGLKWQMYLTIIIFFIVLIDFIISFIEALRVNHILPNLDKIINEYDKKHNIKINKIKTRLLDAFPYLTYNNNELINKLKKLKKEFRKNKN